MERGQVIPVTNKPISLLSIFQAYSIIPQTFSFQHEKFFSDMGYYRKDIKKAYKCRCSTHSMISSIEETNHYSHWTAFQRAFQWYGSYYLNFEVGSYWAKAVGVSMLYVILVCIVSQWVWTFLSIIFHSWTWHPQ